MVKKKKKNNNNKVRKEDISEDCCFVCKDGGGIRICDYKDCLKVYHPNCVGKDESFLESDDDWNCCYHYCNLCGKTSRFRCFFCPTSVCGSCLSDVEFAVAKGEKGFCRHCSKLAFLIEENVDVDSDGEKIDFKAPETYECFFSDYYEIIKKKEGLNSLHVRSARDSIKNGKNKNDFDPFEIGEAEDESEESEEVRNFIVSEYDDPNDAAEGISVSRKKKCAEKLKPIKGKVKSKKKDFIGWGSRSLIEFLKYTGTDTSREFSEHDVASIIIEYCNKNNLFDPNNKRKIICDAQLRSLLRRKSVNKNSIQNLLATHFLENFEEMDTSIGTPPEDREYNEPSNCSTQRKSNHTIVFTEERQSCFAAIISSNIKLVYLKKSFIEELLKKSDTVDSKVLGCFVRTKSDPNDYLQKNSHLLQQVVGVNTLSKIEEINKEVMLQLSNVPKAVPICKISDDDFSEEECQDLYQRMREGLLKKPTVLELEQKARTLHEDMVKHWIPRELALLQSRIDQAYENGWKRQLFEYMRRKQELEDPSEQLRLLSEIPEVIPETVDTNPSPEHSSSKDTNVEQNDLPELATEETCNSVGQSSKHSSFGQSLDKDTAVVARCGFAQPSNTESGSGVDDRNLSVIINANQTIERRQSIPATDPIATTINDVIVLSDSDEEDANIADTSVGRKEVEDPDISIWHCSGPYGERGGPYSMSTLKLWNDDALFSLEKYKVWKTGQSETQAIPLPIALRQFFPQ